MIKVDDKKIKIQAEDMDEVLTDLSSVIWELRNKLNVEEFNLKFAIMLGFFTKEELANINEMDSEIYENKIKEIYENKIKEIWG